jgi:hypothetical protein
VRRARNAEPVCSGIPKDSASLSGLRRINRESVHVS